MILCHKCSGVLASRGENTDGLFGCGCISGYVRGFEPNLSRQEAVVSQIKATNQRISLFVSQGRGDDYIAPLRSRIAKLESLAC